MSPLGKQLFEPKKSPEAEAQRKAVRQNEAAAERLRKALERLGPIHELSEALDARPT